jgi:drug/metabolite transporter (DMT)-like permease
MRLTETRTGELAILSESILWSLFPIVTIVSLSSISSILSLAYSTLFAGVFFAVVVVWRGKIKELFSAGTMVYMLPITFFIGWLFYGLYFSGLKFTTSGNASIIAEMEIFFSYLLFNVWKKQPFSGGNITGALLMLVGAIIILFPKGGFSFRGGDWLVLAASACAPIGNYYQQKLRKKISSESLLFLRSLFSFPFFFLLAFLFKTDASWAISPKLFWLLLLNGFVLLGFSKIMWLEGIHRISVTKSAALASISPLFTLLFAYIFLKQAPTIWQLSAFIPLAAGLVLLTKDQTLPLPDAAKP